MSAHRATHFNPRFIQEFDKIFTMDRYVQSKVLSHARAKLESKKIKMLMSAVYPDQAIEVDDPYQCNESEFLKVFQ